MQDHPSGVTASALQKGWSHQMGITRSTFQTVRVLTHPLWCGACLKHNTIQRGVDMGVAAQKMSWITDFTVPARFCIVDKAVESN